VADNIQRDDEGQGKKTGWIGFIIRFVVSAIVLMVTAFLTPGFKNMGFGTALLAALVIAALDYIVQKLFKIDAAPFGRGLSGFIISAVIIYISQFIVPGMSINIFGAIVAALIIGIIDAILPVDVV
jgi:putative membrane protein